MSPHGHVALGTIGLTLLFWFLGQWLLFVVRAQHVLGKLRLERELWDERGPVQNLWAGRSFEVRARLSLDGWLGLPHVRLKDRVPARGRSYGRPGRMGRQHRAGPAGGAAISHSLFRGWPVEV